MKKLFLGVLLSVFCFGLSIDAKEETFIEDKVEVEALDFNQKSIKTLNSKKKNEFKNTSQNVEIKYTASAEYYLNVTSGSDVTSGATTCTADAGERCYERIVTGTGALRGDTIVLRSYFKNVNGSWFHYKNELINRSEGDKDVITFFQAASCSATGATTFVAYNCAKVDSGLARIHTWATWYEYDESTGTFVDRDIATFRDNNVDDGYILLLMYDSRGRLINRETVTRNSSGYMTKIVDDFRSYYSNGRIDEQDIFTFHFNNRENLTNVVHNYRRNYTTGVAFKVARYNYKGWNFSFNGGWERTNNNKGKLTHYLVYRPNTTVSHAERRTYYSNGKQNLRNVTKRNANGVIISGFNTKHRSNGKIQWKKTMAYSKGKRTRMVTLQYNGAGQLRTNNNGKAFRFVTTFNNNQRITGVTRAQYNGNGRLGAVRTVNATDLTRTFVMVTARNLELEFYSN